MRLTLLLAGALVPAAMAGELIPRLYAPTLERALARARPQAAEHTPGHAADAVWIAREIHEVQPPAPTAPHAWFALTGERSVERSIWHADPIHVAVGREHLTVHPLDAAAPSDAEADALIGAGNELLADADCELRRVDAHWFLRVPEDWALRHATTAAMLGRPLPLAAHDEADALRWNRLHTALQMQWHADPVNRARAERGMPTVDALWLHGGGRWSPLPRLRWSTVHSDRPALRGAALAAGADVQPASASVRGDALLVWDDASQPAGFDGERWLAALQTIDRRMAELPPADLELVLTGASHRRAWLARPLDHLRIWQRNRLPEALAA
jgi:hypothetical protein